MNDTYSDLLHGPRVEWRLAYGVFAYWYLLETVNRVRFSFLIINMSSTFYMMRAFAFALLCYLTSFLHVLFLSVSYLVEFEPSFQLVIILLLHTDRLIYIWQDSIQDLFFLFYRCRIAESTDISNQTRILRAFS